MIDEKKVPAYDGPLAEDDPWLTTSEVMGLLKVSRQTVANWRKTGKLNAYRIGARAVRFKKSELVDVANAVNSIKRI